MDPQNGEAYKPYKPEGPARASFTETGIPQKALLQYVLPMKIQESEFLGPCINP